jgi:hypothetical protein
MEGFPSIYFVETNMNLERDKKYWINCIKYPDEFMVCSDGRFLSLRTGKELKQGTNHNGYKVISSRIGGRKGKAICLRVHVEVALLYVPNPHNYPLVNHIDGDKTHNEWWNLEWCTHAMNMEHGVRLGLFPKGPNLERRKLTPEQIDHIVKNPDKLSSRALGRQFGVHHKVILKYRKLSTLKSRIK